MRMYVTNQKYFMFILFIFLLVFSMVDITHALPVCDRTTQVREAIVTAAGVADCSDVTDAHLAAITTLDLTEGIETLKNGDFDGLSALTTLSLNSYGLTWLPQDVFAGLTALTNLSLDGNLFTWLYPDVFDGLSALTSLSLDNTPLTWLPANIFDGLDKLTSLSLDRNALTWLPAFDGLSALTSLSLDSNALTWLPNGVFAGLSALTSLSLDGNPFTWLPADIFDGLSALTSLSLDSNALTWLPNGVFDGLTALTTLSVVRVDVNADPLQTIISLEKVGVGQFKATASTGAPFDIALPISVTNGNISNGVSTITIPIGSLESEPLTVARTAGTSVAVTVDIGTLPSIPSNHQGYVLARHEDLPLEVIGESVNVPVFTEGSTTIRTIAENTAAGVDIGSAVSATDVDADDTLTYSLGGTDAASFNIVSTTGQLKTKAALDHETTSSYTVSISVSDGTGVGTDTIAVTINITDVNEAPVFADGSTTTRTIAENTAANENIGTSVSADDPENNTLTYSLSGTDAASFDIDTTSGQLKTNAALDYETKNAYSVTVSVSDGNSGEGSITVRINVTDVNEAPIFTTDGGTTIREIAENTAAGVNIGSAVSATDQENDTLTYSLSGTDAASFDIVSTSGQLQTNAALNYQTKSSYEVVITVSDGSLTDTITVAITVVNQVCTRTQQVRDAIVDAVGVADCSDVTDAHLAAITSLDISGETITSLQRHDFNGLTSLTSLSVHDTELEWLHEDAFAGLSALTNLSLHDNELEWLHDDIFAGLTNLTSLSLSNNQLDWLPNDIFDGLTALTTLTMDGNMRSMWTIISLEKVGAGQFKATASTGAPFDIALPISVTNGNISNGVSTITIPIGSLESEPLTVARTAGTSVAVTVDIGTLPSIPSNHQGYVLARHEDLPLEVIGESVNVPVFTEGSTTIRTIAENTAAGVDIGSAVSATDVDADDTLTYSLGGTDAASFDIVSTTGQLKTKAALDHETTSSYTVSISVSDGTGVGTDTIAVTINITDVNEAPVFADGSTTTRTIAENTAANENIGTSVSADDPENNTLTYSLSGTDAASFDIDTTSGQLKTNAALDYETKNAYLVTVSVSDSTLTDTINVTINVTDVDENRAPVFTEGEETTRAIAENTTDGIAIGTPVSATDADDDPLTYSLGGTDAASFSIVSTSGQLQTNAALDYENKPSYTVTITVSDDGNLSNTITVTINITNVNEAPVFTDGENTTRAIAENTATSENIGLAVAATDVDADDPLRYTLGGTNAASFSIVSTSGQLQTNAALDYETKRSYSVTINVSDGTLSDTITVRINVTDVNEAPVFTNGSTTTRSIAENTRAGVNIQSVVSATDVDVGTTLRYTLGGTDAASFSIVSTSGQLKTNAALDYETKRSYSVTINVSDGTLTDTITVTITVTNVNDVAPVFTDGENTTRAIAENTATDADIEDPVEATDQENDTLTYSLGGTDAASFSIVSTSGQLQTNAALDYETKRSYSVTINVSDGTLSDTITVRINVTDVNEAPVFTNGSTTTRSIAENTRAGVNIQSVVSATDVDVGTTLRYTLGGTDAASFRIESSSGQLLTYASLDYETKSSYSVIVTVSDGRGGSDSITVTINIIRNYDPVFTEGRRTTRSVEENTGSGAAVGDPVSATDANNDTLRYILLYGTDAASFRIDSSSGQLLTYASLDYEMKSSYTVTVSASDGYQGSNRISVTINVIDVYEPPPDPVPPPSDRTQQVQDAILAAVSDVSNVDDLRAFHLSAITSLSISAEDVTSLKSGDFNDLTGLTYLDLSYNTLSSLPSDIFNDTTSLTILYLDNNQLSSLPSLSSLTSLTELYLNDNSLSLAPSLSGLSSLKYLDLSSNQLSSAPSVSGLSALTHLYLNNNSLSSAPSVSGLSSLEDLDLSSNQLSSAPSVSGLSSLEDLNLSSNQLSSAPSVSGLSSLEDLNLSSNQLRSALSVSGLSSLKRLSLSNNSLTSLSVSGLSSLERLNVNDNSLSSLSVSGLTSLIWLNANDNNLSSLPSISNPSSLITLKLNSNNISSLPSGSFEGFTSLSSLGLSLNAINLLPLNVSLEKVSSGQVKAVAPTGAPFDIVLPLSVTNGSISGGSSSITISKGSTESSSLTVSRTAGTTAAVTVDIGTLPGLPSGHSGYALVKSGTLPLEVISAIGGAPAQVSNLNPQVPDATSVLPNYPNPSNPETWIPYQLAKPAKVTFTIYNTRGVVVRRLSLGHQLTGFYHNRSRAAYWDGKNESGESVASGIYFYTFAADDFTATRKILIRK